VPPHESFKKRGLLLRIISWLLHFLQACILKINAGSRGIYIKYKRHFWTRLTYSISSKSNASDLDSKHSRPRPGVLGAVESRQQGQTPRAPADGKTCLLSLLMTWNLRQDKHIDFLIRTNRDYRMFLRIEYCSLIIDSRCFRQYVVLQAHTKKQG
jgi:hypothetical protein